MKKLILLIILFPVLAFGQGMQPVGHVVTSGPADGVIGTSTNNGGAAYFSGGIVYNDVVTTTAGTIGYCHIYVNPGGSSTTFPLSIGNSSGTRLAYGSVTSSSSSDGWLHVTLNTTITLTAATTYRLAAGCSTSWTATYQTAAVVGKEIDTAAESYANPLPSSLSYSAQAGPGNIIAMSCNNSATTP